MITLFVSSAAVVCITMVAWKRPAHAVATIAAALPSYLVRFSLLGIPFTLLESLILAVSATVAIRFFVEQQAAHTWHRSFAGLWKRWLPRTRNRQWVLLWMLWFAVAGILGVLVTPDVRSGLGQFKAYIIEPMLFFLVFLYSIKSRKDLAGVVWALGISATGIALMAIVQYATGWGIPEPWHDLPGRRATAVYGYPNAVGLYVTPIAAMLFGVLLFVKNTSRAQRLLAAGAVVVCAAALVAARVEGGIVALAASVFVMLLFTRYRFVAVFAGAALFLLACTIEPLANILLFRDVSGNVRLALWQGTLNLLSHHPFSGAGLAGFPILYDVYRLPSHVELLQYPHNIFLDFWVQLGVLGVLWFVATLLWFCRTAWRCSRASLETGAILFGVMSALLVYGMVDVPYFKNDLAILFWTFFGTVQFLYTSSSTKR